MDLSKSGRTEYVIHIPAQAPTSIRLAGDEIARYLHEITGATFPVRQGGAIPKRAVVLAAAGSGEGYTLAVEGERVRITGGRGRAVLFGAYDFLERLGCRWLSPGFGFYQGAHEVVPRAPTLRFECPAPIRERPGLAFRKLYVEEGHSHDAERMAQIVAWMPKLRFNTLVVPTDYQGRGRVRWDNWREKLTPELQSRDLTIEVGGHGYQNFLNAEMEAGALFQRHPEWFGLDPQGKRRREPGWVPCTSNADERAYLTRNFLDYVRERPEIRIFDFWPPDGARWCECGPCRVLGSPSNRQALLVNELKTAAARVRPDLRLEVLAYQTSITPPETARLDPGVLLDFCPIRQRFEQPIDDVSEPIHDAYVKGLAAWRKAFSGDISIYSYYRKYAWKSLPAIIPHYMRRDLEWYRRLPIQGVSTYAEPGDWGTYELNHYILGRLAWDPEADVDAAVDEFCRARFGSAAKAARAAHDALERIVRTTCSLPSTSLKSVERIEAAEQELSRRAIAVSAAVAEARTEPLRRLGLCLEYARRDLAVQHERAAGRADEARGKVEELARFLAANADRGVFLMHARLELPRLLQSYGLAGRQ